MKRRRFKKAVAGLKRSGGDYFPGMGEGPECIPTGCAVLDCILGGGWPLGRIVNIVGDKAVGKTLLAIEAAANFGKKYPKGKIWYREAEAAFDEGYAVKLGLPIKRVDFGPDGINTPWDTVEDIFEDLDKQLRTNPAQGLYIIDSLDALSSRAELKRSVDEGSFGLEKQKVLGQLFRRLSRRVRSANVCVIFISQVRDKIGVMFGDKHTRTGGKSLDFYTTIILWLSHLKIMTRTIGGMKRATAVRVLANCKKNKVTAPFGKCEFMIRFGFGVDDVEASLEFLAEAKMLDRLGIKISGVGDYLADLEQLSLEEYKERASAIRDVVMASWEEVQARFEPSRSKY